MHLGCINEALDLDDFSALEFDLLEIFRRDDDVLVWFELVAFDDFFVWQDLAALFALFIVADWAVVLFVQLVKPDRRFGGINSVVNPDRYRDEGKTNMTF